MAAAPTSLARSTKALRSRPCLAPGRSCMQPCHVALHSRLSNQLQRPVQVPAAMPAGSTASGAASTSYTAAFPGGVYSCEMQVRDYELDQFNVVNNAIYASYLQHGRHEAFAELGHDVDSFARQGSPLALSQLNMSFKAPLRSRDRFRVEVWVAKITAARVVMGQAIWLLPPAGGEGKETQVLGAEATVVFLDANYRPDRMPQQVKKDFDTLHALFTAAHPTLAT